MLKYKLRFKIKCFLPNLLFNHPIFVTHTHYLSVKALMRIPLNAFSNNNFRSEFCARPYSTLFLEKFKIKYFLDTIFRIIVFILLTFNF